MRRCREGRRHRRETPVTIFALLLHLAVQRRHRSPGSSSRFDFFSSHVFKFSSFFFCARVFFVLIFDEEKGAHKLYSSVKKRAFANYNYYAALLSTKSIYIYSICYARTSHARCVKRECLNFRNALTSCSHTTSKALTRCFNHSKEASLPKQIWKFSSSVVSPSSPSSFRCSLPPVCENDAERGGSVVNTSLNETKLNAPPWSVLGNGSRHSAHVPLLRSHLV